MAELDWSDLSFKYRKTNVIITSYYKDGVWSEPVASHDFDFHFSAFAGVFHYANACFEGLKAFRGVDGRVRLFRPDENAKRLQKSGGHLDMATPSEEMFIDMCVKCVEANIEFLPPYGYGASMYLRPVLIGCNPQLGIASSTEVLFAVMCSPVGTYSGAKSLSPGTATLARNYDRAAPNGTGQYKIAANYATSLHPYNLAHRQGYRELLFLDPATKTKIDEFGSSNFLAIKGNTYVTPLSDSVLPSITNKTLQAVAQDFGMTVEKRAVYVDELAEFEEINACGTAVVITPICSIDDKPTLESSEITRTFHMPSGDECGKVSRKLYDRIRGIQDGLEEDTHNWCIVL
ncbi:MAG: branched-chain amino acid aminotransferase [Bacteroidales bacterium]|nr:branched-chain amino acid aminotransferase [Candidatus Cryptobacteroides caccocaballi]